MTSTIDRMMSATDLSRGQVGKALSMVQVGEPVIILKRSEPAAVMITPEEYADYERMRKEGEDAADLALAQERLERWDGNEHDLTGLEELSKEFGITDEDLAKIPDVEFE